MAFRTDSGKAWTGVLIEQQFLGIATQNDKTAKQTKIPY
jgi:hypothetical protein